MNLFNDVQKLTEKGTRQKISVPFSKSIILSNKTNADVLIFHEQSSKIGYPIKPNEDLEVETISETADFFAELQTEEITGNEGLYIIAQTTTVEYEVSKRTNNTVVIN